MARTGEQDPDAAQELDAINVTWRNSLFGIGTAICFAVSAIFIRNGLDGLPSPLLGVTVGMISSTLAYGLVLLFRRTRIRQGPIPQGELVVQILAGATVGLSTWARWIALDLAPVAVVMALGRLNVPVVILLAPLLVGRKAERVTARVWLGAALIVAGAVLLNVFS
jgi:uncharacterized membrane protein